MIESTIGVAYQCLDLQINWRKNTPPDLRQKLARCKNYLKLLITKRIGWEEYLFCLSVEGVNIDEYLNTVEANFKSAGLV